MLFLAANLTAGICQFRLNHYAGRNWNMPTEPANPGSCTACRLRREECVCSHAPRLCISTRLVVIIHSKEWRKTTNTGHFARLAIKDAEVRLHGAPRRTVSSAGIVAASSTLVLFPGRGAHPLNPAYIASLPRPLTLLVPDGNWNQAQHMMRRLPMLHQARPVRLDGSALDPNGLRRNHCDGRMSTFEAIAQALGILEGRETEDHLLKFFGRVLERMTDNSRRSGRGMARSTG
jgi:DTW domain-containing protein